MSETAFAEKVQGNQYEKKDRSKIRNIIKTHYCILLCDGTFVLAQKQNLCCCPFNLICVKQKPFNIDSEGCKKNLRIV